MKVRILTSMVLAVMVITASCKKDTVKEVTQPSAMKAKVDGADWVSAVTTAAFDTESQTLNVGGLSDGKGSISVIVTEAKTGDFDEQTGATCSFVEGNATSTKVWSTDVGGTAAVKITKFDKTAKKVSGTFSFTAAGAGLGADGNKTVAGGVFNDVDLVIN